MLHEHANIGKKCHSPKDLGIFSDLIDSQKEK